MIAKKGQPTKDASEPRAKKNKSVSESEVGRQGDVQNLPNSKLKKGTNTKSVLLNQSTKNAKLVENNNTKMNSLKKDLKSNETKENNQTGGITTKTQEVSSASKLETPSLKETSAKSETSNSLVVNGSISRTGRVFVGAHCSGAGGLHNAVTNAKAINAKSFALFLRPQRTWNSKPLDLGVAQKFKDLCLEHGYSPNHILPHGSYLVNLASPKPELRLKSENLLREELERCSELGLTMFNIHPGSSCGEINKETAIEYIAEGINRVLADTKGVKVVLENMSGQGHTIGGDFRELKEIIDRVEDKSRVGVCLDTCHAMAAGYDLSRQEGFDAFINCFSEQVGFEWLVGVHLNDSKGPAGCNQDRHENIGKGTIGVEGFRRIINCKHFKDLPLILETPSQSQDGYRIEIDLLEGLVTK